MTTLKISMPKEVLIEGLKINVRLITKEDIQSRNLPTNTTGVVITNIENDSPVNYLKVNNIIVEAQKKLIRTIDQLDNIVKIAQRSSEKTMLLAVYNNRNQRRDMESGK